MLFLRFGARRHDHLARDVLDSNRLFKNSCLVEEQGLTTSASGMDGSSSFSFIGGDARPLSASPFAEKERRRYLREPVRPKKE
jgi:hypothetical protein